MERETGRHDSTSVPATRTYRIYIQSSDKTGRGIIPSSGFTFLLARDGEDLMVDGKIPPTLTWVAGAGGSTLVSNLEKGVDTR